MNDHYDELVRQEREHYSSIPRTDELTEQAPPCWEYLERQTDKLIEKATGMSPRLGYVASLVNAKPSARILSLGTGPGAVEMELAKQLTCDYEIVCTDINEDILAMGRERAREQGLNLTFQQVDVNRIELEERSFDLVTAFASLHHFVELEHIFSQVNRALKPDGHFVTLDVVTQNRFVMWPETYEMVSRIWAILPDQFKIDHTGSAEPLFSPEPSNSPTSFGFECVRSQDILPLLAEYLDPILYIPLYSISRRFLDTKYGPNFDMNVELDRAIVEFIWYLDCYLVEKKVLPPETMFAVLRKRGTTDPEIAQTLREKMLYDSRNALQDPGRRLDIALGYAGREEKHHTTFDHNEELYYIAVAVHRLRRKWYFPLLQRLARWIL